MYIRCPKCGRRGHLPDHLAPEAHSLRCRKCRAQFKTPELARQSIEAGAGAGAGLAPIAGLGRAEAPSAFLADGFFGAFDEQRTPGPGDSNYELTFALRDAEGDSGADWDAEADGLEPEAPSSDEIAALAPVGPAPAPGPEPWHHRFIDSWGLGLVVAALVLIAISLPLIAYLLWRTLGAGATLDLPASALLAGFACAVALLTIAVPLILLAAAVTELARDVRRLHAQPGNRGLIERR